MDKYNSLWYFNTVSKKFSILRKLSVFLFIFFILFGQVILHTAHQAQAAVLWDNSHIGSTYTITATSTANGYYTRYPQYSGSGSLFPGGGTLLGGTPAVLRVKRISGVSCGAIVTHDIYATNGSTTIGTVGTGSANGAYCDFPITSGANIAVGYIALCVNYACTNSWGSLMLAGSSANPGYTYNGNQDSGFPGGFAFQICDSGGCTGGFTQQVNTVSSNITASTTWHKDVIYVVSGNIEVTSGNTLTIEPGTIVKFDTSTSSSLTINGTLVAVGEQDSETLNQIIFTSLADDSVGGDTNNDATATSGADDDWGGISIGSGGIASFDYVTIRYGGGGTSAAEVYNGGGTLTMEHTTVTRGTTYAIKNISGTASISTSSDLSYNDYGFYLAGGTATVSGGAGTANTIHNNSLYGIYNATTSDIAAENNYWGDPTGPYHATNTGGLGNAISDHVDFDPWTEDLHYVINELFSACLPDDCSSVDENGELLWKSTSSYSSEVSGAVSTWDALGGVDLVEENLTPNLVISDVDRDDVAWKGVWDYTQIPDDLLLNSYYLDLNSSSQVQNTITHELGHALGLGHSYPGNVMYFNQTSQTGLGTQDMSDYNYLWQ